MTTVVRYLSVLILLVAGLASVTSCSSNKIIVNGLDEREANEILVFLANKGISGSKIQAAEAGGGGASKVVTWDIQVPTEQSTEAMALLNQAGLPRRRSQSLLNIFTGGSLVPSELQEKIRYQAGLAETIASTIRKIDGVLDTEVQLSFPEEDPLHPGVTKGKVTASVYVKHTGVLDDPNAHLPSKIKRLVSASVPNLDYDNVTVIGDRARYSSLRVDELNAEGAEPKQYVSIWTIVLAKDSLFRFRVVFFSFMIVILILLISLVWIMRKLYPILKEHGGLRELFRLKPISLKPPEDANKAIEEEEKAKEGEEPTDKDAGVT